VQHQDNWKREESKQPELELSTRFSEVVGFWCKLNYPEFWNTKSISQTPKKLVLRLHSREELREVSL